VYGPGKSALMIVPERPRSSGTHSKSMSMSFATSEIGWSGGRCFSFDRRSTGSGVYGEHARP
jgi:hypothetical protein